MTISDTVNFEVKVTHAYTEDLPRRRGQAEDFWLPLIERRRTLVAAAEIPSITILEKKLSIALPRYIRSKLAEYFLISGRGSPEEPSVNHSRAASLLPLIGLSVGAIRYGSLDLSIEITGVKHLLELFDSNFDLFMMFAQTYLPDAFSNTMGELQLHNNDFFLQVIPSAGLASAFANPSSAVPAASSLPQSVTPHSLDRAKAIWQISNFTLLVPVGLALLVLYVGARSIMEEKSDLKEWRKNILAREEAYAKSGQDRLTQLEKIQVELIALLKDSPRNTEKKK